MDTMRCPACKGTATKQKHEDRFVCRCGWKSREPGMNYDALKAYLNTRRK